MGKKKISFLRRVGFVLEASIVIPLGNLALLLPWRTGRAIASVAGLFLFCISEKGKNRARENLDIIYWEHPLSEKEKTQIIRRLFVNMATSAFEYLKIRNITADNCLEFVHIDEALYRAIREDRGFIVVSAHVGNWEYLGSIAAKLGKNLGAVIHRQLNPYTDKWLREIREKDGKIRCFYDEVSAMRPMVAHLRRNGTLAILADERHLNNPVFVPFFGRQAATPDGPARLHLLYGTPIVFCFSIKQEDGKYLLTFDGPYHFEKSGDLKKDCEVIMTCMNKKYEEVIRRHPDQWFSLLTPRWERGRPENPEKKGRR